MYTKIIWYLKKKETRIYVEILFWYDYDLGLHIDRRNIHVQKFCYSSKILF